jgi:uncharacterized membrane protein YdjX (TVP38/TMEM64 family)
LIRPVGLTFTYNVSGHTVVDLVQCFLRRLDAHPVQSILLSRVVFQTLPALNYALAMSGVKLRHYIVGTLLGLPLPIALYCVFFDFLATTVFRIR